MLNPSSNQVHVIQNSEITFLSFKLVIKRPENTGKISTKKAFLFIVCGNII